MEKIEQRFMPTFVLGGVTVGSGSIHLEWQLSSQGELVLGVVGRCLNLTRVGGING